MDKLQASSDEFECNPGRDNIMLSNISKRTHVSSNAGKSQPRQFGGNVCECEIQI